MVLLESPPPCETTAAVYSFRSLKRSFHIGVRGTITARVPAATSIAEGGSYTSKETP